MKQAWMVSTGEYSDYSVLCVCATEEAAKRAVAAYTGADDRWGDARIESILLFEDTDTPQRIATHCAEVVLWDDGRVGQERRRTFADWNFALAMIENPPSRPEVEYVRAPILHGLGGYLRIRGADEMSVAKVLTERLAAFKSGSWMPHRGVQDTEATA
jgi:hypothetical protein